MRGQKRGQKRGQNNTTTLPAWKEIAVFECERRMLNREDRTEGAERGPLAAHALPEQALWPFSPICTAFNAKAFWDRKRLAAWLQRIYIHRMSLSQAQSVTCHLGGGVVTWCCMLEQVSVGNARSRRNGANTTMRQSNKLRR